MNKKLLIFELVLICLTFLFGSYFFYWEILLRKDISNQEYFIYFALITSVLTLIILFFRHNVLNLNKEIQEKNDLQKQYIQKLNKTYEGTLKALAYALDYRDHETWGHSARVVGYATAIAEKMGLGQEELQKLAWAGFLHDIGKIGVPDSILLKKTKLQPQEWEAIKRHPELGYEIVKQIDFLESAAHIILLHHEHYDGSGYPLGLKSEKIPLAARIFAVADALDAMTSNRPYRPAHSMEEAVNEVLRLSGKQFCPECAKALIALGIKNLHQIELRVKDHGDVKMLRRGLEPWQVVN
ncbi:MAG TPA: hypothetical protein DDW93_12835 [Firmicutes bacterium]|mgnify:CR=1 FL=1|jgi:putative nucleotidyltransferase with HDIG domain|nr:hypothetical protein [Bacillota bacterium]HBK69828.1 hypothetical protein [Bacillota bacterium]HBT15840.1 hypothetical protein [Bacillota bacterium]